MKTKKGTKVLALFLAVTLTLGLCACGNEETTKETESSIEETVSVEQEAEVVETEETGKIGNGEKLVIGMMQNSLVSGDYEETELAKKLEEELGVELEFYVLPADGDDAKTKLNLLATDTEEMPDILMLNMSLDNAVVLNYGQNDIFVDLTDYINDPSMMKYFNEIPEEDRNIITSSIKSADGRIYGLCNFQPESWNYTPTRLYINKAWLTKLNLEVPTTTDELFDVLLHFVNDDPNGNGKKDEIGAYGYMGGGYGQNIIWGLMNSFTFFNGFKQNNGLALSEDGKTVIAPFATDEWRAGIEYLKKLYDNGILPSSVFTDDDSMFKANLNAETPIVGLTSFGSFGNYTDYATNPNLAEMEIVAPFAGPDGKAYAMYTTGSTNCNTFITTNCENVELAVKFLDYFYSEEISASVRYGIEGIDWTMDEEVTKDYTNSYIESGIIDKPYLVYNIGGRDTWNEANNVIWHNVGPRYASLSMGIGAVDGSVEYDADSISNIAHAFNDAHYLNAVPEHILPVLVYTTEETEAITVPTADIKNEVQATLAAFVTGQVAIDENSWSEYIRRLEALGLNEWVAIAQTAYDR